MARTPADTLVIDIMAARIRGALPEDVAGDARGRLVEKRMFGGIGFMLDGNLLCCATRSGGALWRVGAGGVAAALALPTARPFINGTRPMTGYVVIDAEGLADDGVLAKAAALALDFVETLPPQNKPPH